MTLTEFMDKNAELTKEGFLRQYDHPFLMAMETHSEGSDAEASTLLLNSPKVQMDKANLEWFGEVYLVKSSGAGEGRTPKAVLGRGESCDIVLADSAISKQHAEIILEPHGAALLRDLGSKNGSAINLVGLQPSKTYLLSDGDMIILGGSRSFLFCSAESLFSLMRVARGI